MMNFRNFQTIVKLASWYLAVAVVFVPGLANGQVQTIRFLSLNVDFNNSKAKIQADVQAVAPKADIMMFEEAKTVTIDDYLDDQWTVYQVVDAGDAKRGSAIAVRNSVVSRFHNHGLILGVAHGDAAMLDRYIAWMDVELTGGRVIRVMALHMPPARFDYLQPPMAENFANFVEVTPYPVIAGADWNTNVNKDPLGIQDMTGLVPRGVGIDGFFYDPSVFTATSTKALTGLDVNSDHDPVQMTVQVEAVSAVGDWELY